MLGSVLFSLAFVGVVLSQTPRLLGKISAKHAGFLGLLDNNNSGSADRYTLLVASFNGFPFSTDYVFAVPRIGNFLTNLRGATVQTLTAKVTWPNHIDGVPGNVFGPGMVAIPDGFLVPFKRRGSLSIMNVTSTPVQGPFKISDDSGTEWFYHKVIWKDMDKDGLMDAVTCRATVKGHGSFGGELLWFKNPGAPYFKTTWKANVIATGPDVYLTPARLPVPGGANLDTLLIPGYFNKRLSVYWIEGTGTWTNPKTVKSRVIEDNSEVGAFFDVQYVDVNGDGKKDLLATSSNAQNGSVIVYELPSDFRVGTFKKHLIASGFKPKTAGQGKSSPGSAQVFTTRTNQTSSFRRFLVETPSRPLILLSGDDDGKAYILTASSTDPTNWTYQVKAFVEARSGPVGSVAIADVDGDGFTELFIPEYDSGEIMVYTFKTT